jgi:hypothetical protein
MRWIHIDFWFNKINRRTDYYLNKKEQKDFEGLIRNILLGLKDKIKRKFYLYEDIPSCFLALELKDEKGISMVKKIIKKIQRPYIYKVLINLSCDDRSNGEGFLDILNAFTDFYLFKRDNRITHIVHCCMEFMLQSRQKECQFYQNMATLYQVVKRDGKKIVYGYKKFNLQLRKKLKKYIHSLNLEND